MNLNAQQSKESTAQSRKASRIEMAQKQATRIANELSFSNETRDRFIATFVNCQQEMWNLRKVNKNKSKKSIDVLSDQETDSIIKARFDFSQRTLDLRRKYYDEYRKFLTPRQINQVYEQERIMMQRLGENGHSTQMGRKTHPQRPSKRHRSVTNR